MRVGGSRSSWSLIVWLVRTGFSSRALSSQRGEESEEISDGTSPPCGLLTGPPLKLARESLLKDNNVCVVDGKAVIIYNVSLSRKSPTPDTEVLLLLLSDKEVTV